MTSSKFAVTSAFVCVAFGADFWVDKKPADWSEKDAKRMLSKSPWAKEVMVQFAGGGGGIPSGGGGGRGRGGGGGGGGRGGGMGGGEGMGGGGGRGGAGGDGINNAGGDSSGGSNGVGGGSGMQVPAVLVLWNSAPPIHEAKVKLEEKDPAEAKFADYYVVSVIGFPMRQQQGMDPARLRERLTSSTSLTAKGKDPILAENVGFTKTPDNKSVIVFLFPRKAAISSGDKEVTFQSAMGPMQIRAKFTLKDMNFDGKLAL